ncbi:helix-turn-helix domain-containing protein [Spirosoma litoris]
MNNLVLVLKAYKSDVEIHRHSAYQIVFTTDNPFLTVCDNKKCENIFGFVIKPQVEHSCTCSNSNLIIMNIETYSFMGEKLAEKLGDKNTELFRSRDEFMDFFMLSGDEIRIQDIVKSIQLKDDIQRVDSRILNAIELINSGYQSNRLTLEYVAKTVCLSPSRLTFLFKQQTGSSIMKLLVWIRVRNAIARILTQKDELFTSIAYECGFYDSAQMNKYMYQLFGISPSKLRKKSDLIQFLQ